ncbi:hypothetical protein ACHWQZ_G016444 [Mnemiopsis leidyi]
MFKSILFLSFLLLSCSGNNLPSWPKQFRWFWGGSSAGYSCITIDEPGSPDFADNRLCWESGFQNPGFKWSWAGVISGMRCTKIHDSGNPSWADNYLCVPDDSPYDFVFSWAGRILGKACINMNEPGEAAWNDNFLCATTGVGPSL